MARWAIGDVQGCLATLQRLVARLQGELWFVGDLVNRGPDSLGVLRWVMGQGDRVTAVLGNHDLHLLARRAGASAGKHDTLDALLEAPDRDVLCEWLRQRPLLVERDGWLLCHAGLLPRWSLAEARHWAAAGEVALRGPHASARLLKLRQNTPWDLASADDRITLAIGALTRIRMVDGYGEPASFSGPLEEAPPGLFPWWERSPVPSPERRVVIGHWAALGYRDLPGVLAIDTGCIWGRALTAVNLDTGERLSEPCAEVLPRRPRGAA